MLVELNVKIKRQKCFLNRTFHSISEQAKRHFERRHREKQGKDQGYKGKHYKGKGNKGKHYKGKGYKVKDYKGKDYKGKGISTVCIMMSQCSALNYYLASRVDQHSAL